MPKHIPPFDNKNVPIIEENNKTVPTIYFNRVVLNAGEKHEFRLNSYEAVVVAASGTVDIKVGDKTFSSVGKRSDVWDGNADSVYVGLDNPTVITCTSDKCQVFIAGGKTDEKFEPFRVTPEEVTKIQYGSDDTKTHRQIRHILGQNANEKCSRLLVSELFTVGAGGWSGFPSHKHDTNRLPHENRFEEAYYFRFNPEQGFGAQFGTLEGEEVGEVFHIRNGSTYMIDYGYHPCVAAPGYEMYYFTIIVGETGRSLIQHFHPDHAHQIETIPGIKAMIAGFK